MTKEVSGNRLGDYIQRQRLRRRLSLRGLAAAAGLNASYVMRLERGEYASPDPRHLRELARVLEVDPADLYLAAGYRDAATLPGLAPYLRTKYDLPAEAVSQLQAHFELLADKYDAGGAEQQGGSHGRRDP